MKRYEGSKYDVRDIYGYGRLVLCHDDTIEGVRADIDFSNKRAVENGYSESQWIITHEEWYSYYDDDGKFLKSEYYESAVEVYPSTC